MSGRIIAVYSLKGGVGKTTIAVNLAWAAAALSSRRTLLWDLDAQAAATWILGHGAGGPKAEKTILGAVNPEKLVRATDIPRLDLLPADASLRGLDIAFHELDKKKRVAKLAQRLARDHDRILIDCPPGLSDTSDQILRAADLVVVPVIPSPLSRRALATIEQHLHGKKSPDARLLPVYSMVDRRRALHRAALEAEPDWPVIPMASAFEAMSEARAPLGAYAPRRAVGVAAIAGLWERIERKLEKRR
ncbi:ParA family protein [Hephaestia mangrovi]|uniref:ParA family protein n=1 Tax=Hephaestia mangrovi TaxID=2873268 RepID=UPI001CA6183F|nr:ParA family protein [Hephaestia mangrovi]MBY8829382.1 ParA family protein [Hephaestia mangrovi]